MGSVYLWQLTALELEDKVWLEGTVIRGHQPQPELASTWLGHLQEVLFSYFKEPATSITIQVHTQYETKEVHTDGKGRFSCLLEAFDPDSLQLKYREDALHPPQGYPYFFKKKKAPVEVISDLDDTVLHSYTASALKRIYSILFILPQKRRPVAYTYELMEWFKERGMRITYLSKSEANLFELISAFLKSKELPRGALLLSPFLRYHQLPKPNKGKDYKYNHLRTLLTEQPDRQVILLGDDTQRDMEIYTSIIHDFPERILKVFIRQSGLGQNDRQRELWNDLQRTQVPAVYFSDGDEAAQEIENLKALVN